MERPVAQDDQDIKMHLITGGLLLLYLQFNNTSNKPNYSGNIYNHIKEFSSPPLFLFVAFFQN